MDEAAIARVLAQLTLEEKVSLMAGADFWSLPPIPRLDIGSLVFSDGPTGLRSTNSLPATVFPVGVALAATWNPELVTEVGAAIGVEAQDHGVDVLLAPGINIQRTPLGGRNFEYYSEDPVLSGVIGAAYVEGVQSTGVGACIKHFAANNQEANRMTVSVEVPEYVLRELYLPAFEMIVRAANPWTVMSAYNQINGSFCSENNWLLNTVLKDEWGYDGVVISDWSAAKNTVPSANGGLSIEMPGPGRVYGAQLLQSVASGDVTEATIDEHATRILRLIARAGKLAGVSSEGPRSSHAPDTALARDTAYRAAAQSIVLLKNDGDVLPLAKGASLAVIGGSAQYPAIQGGGSSQVMPERIVSPLEGLRDRLDANDDLRFERGIDHEAKPPILDGRLLRTAQNGRSQGLNARYFANANFDDTPIVERGEWHLAKLGFGDEVTSADDLAFSVEWSGYLLPRYSGEHLFEVSNAAASVEVMLDGVPLIAQDDEPEVELLFMILPLSRRRASAKLEAGRAYPIRIRYAQAADTAIKGFNIFNVFMREPDPDRSAALAIAQATDYAVIFAGSGTTGETEGEDRASMDLSDAQNALIEDVAAANAKTIVVLNTGGPVTMPWADKVSAIVQQWLPGQEGGVAIADMLLGTIAPTGRLPISFPAHYGDNPTADFYPGDKTVAYGEGLLVGYRHYDRARTQPLFAFGHGLAYTTFDLTEVSCLKGRVEAVVINTGERSGTAVVQAYLADGSAGPDRPVRQLADFARVELAAGESTRVSLQPPDRLFQSFDSDSHAWVDAIGPFTLHLGFSSRDLRCEVAIPRD